MTDTTTRTLKPKAYRVRGPDAKTVTLVYASTEKGAIAKAKASRDKDAEDWSATLATGEDLYLAGVERTRIIDAPTLIQNVDHAAEPQLPLAEPDQESGTFKTY